MASTQDALHRRRACNAVAWISRTVRTLRQHGGVPRLLDAAVAQCKRELAAALLDDALTIELCAGEVRCAGQIVMNYGRTDSPFGLLAEAGVGLMVLAQDTTGEQCERFIRACAGAPATPEPDYDLVVELRAAEIPGLEFRPPSHAPASRGGDDHRADWWLLPEPAPPIALVALIEREAEANLPGRTLTLLLADMQRDDFDRPPGPLLESLLVAMLDDGDAAGIAVLLEHAEHRPEIPADSALLLRRRAVQAYDGNWLFTQLEQEHRLQGLVSLGLQLGDECFDRLTSAAATAGRPLPEWVSSMLPPGE